MTFNEFAKIWSTNGFAGLAGAFKGPVLAPLEPWARVNADRQTRMVDMAMLEQQQAEKKKEEAFSVGPDGVPLVRVVQTAIGEKIPAPVPLLPVVKTGRNTFQSVTIGRSPQNDVLVDQNSVSRFHSEIRFALGQWALRDAESRNGTSLNGLKVVSKHGVAMSPGDVVGFGDVSCLFIPMEQAAIEAVFAKVSTRPKR